MKYLYVEAGGPRDRMYLSQSFNPSYESVWVWVAIYDSRRAQISQFAGMYVKIKKLLRILELSLSLCEYLGMS